MTVIWTVNGENDNGSCCGLKSYLNPYIAKPNGEPKIAKIPESNSDENLLKLNSWACVLWKNGQKLAPNENLLLANEVNNDSTAVKTSWWCNNGLYH